jgi:hypothetical protein
VSDQEPTRSSWRERLGRTRGSGKTRQQRRRFWLRVIAVVAIITIVAVIPGYIATRPQFMRRYAGASEQYASWSKSVHAEVSCQSCHVAPTRVAQSLYAVRMLGEFYVSVVTPGRQPKLFASPTNEACQSCHIDLRTVSPSGDLAIPHRAHVGVLKMRCIRCHDHLVHTANAQGTHAPSMTTCLKCHNGVTAKKECTACHRNKAAPESHKAKDWLVVHPTMQKRVDCTKCHAWTKNWCAQCHSRRPASHVKRWRTVHKVAVKTRRNCEACHEAAFCIRCHGEVPKLNFDPALKLVR